MQFIWPPIMTSIEERQKEIADGLAAAERGQQSLDKAKTEADDIVAEARKQATTIIDQAQARANEIVADGKDAGVKEREQEANRAREELRGQVSAIAVASAEKILRREIDPQAHEDILSKLASEL